jgi:hypothetical protein
MGHNLIANARLAAMTWWLCVLLIFLRQGNSRFMQETLDIHAYCRRRAAGFCRWQPFRT